MLAACSLVDKSNHAAAVDPAEPETIVEAAKREGVTVDTVLTTHKHWCAYLFLVIPAFRFGYTMGYIFATISACVLQKYRSSLSPKTSKAKDDIEFALPLCRDHAGGNDKFKQLVPGVKVIGGVNDNCQGATETVADGDEFDWHDIHIKCIETPL